MQHCFNLPRIWPCALLAYYMAQICDGLSNKVTFVWVQFEIYFPQFAENCIQMLEMLPLTHTVYIEVINKYLQKFATQVFKDFRHGSCECTCCILQSEWHNCPVVQPILSNQRGLLYVLRSHPNLPKTRLQI